MPDLSAPLSASVSTPAGDQMALDEARSEDRPLAAGSDRNPPEPTGRQTPWPRPRLAAIRVKRDRDGHLPLAGDRVAHPRTGEPCVIVGYVSGSLIQPMPPFASSARDRDHPRVLVRRLRATR